MINIQRVNSKQLYGKYDRTKLAKILIEVFDSSNPNWTQFRNPKKFQIKLTENEFKIRKIDKLIDSSDPNYMALTQIRGVLKDDGEYASISLFAEIHLLWLILILLGLIAGVIGSLVYRPELIFIVPVALFMYFSLRLFANKDFERFAPYLEGLIKGARNKTNTKHPYEGPLTTSSDKPS
ncbi:hypothetical protein N8482_01270 [Chitinophagales bacterium]|nr:hypothetical protein [Chitinophagales bacterium]